MVFIAAGASLVTKVQPDFQVFSLTGAGSV
jgi:hypothetical protein